MKKHRNFLFLFFSIISISGCVQDKAPIRIGTNAWPPCEIWYVAEQQGMFESVPVEIKRFSSWTDNMSSLYKGNIDITHATYFNAVYFHDKGEAGTIILSTDVIQGSDGLVVRSGFIEDSGFNSDRFRGKLVAVEINTDEHFLLKKALDEYGLSEEDVELRSMTSYEASEAFINGEVDAAFVYEPFLTQAAEEGSGNIIWTTKELPGYMIDVLIVRNKVLETRRKDVAQLISAWYDAQDYIRTERGEVFAVMAANEDMPADVFEAFYDGFTFFSPEENVEIFNSKAFRARLEEMNDFLLEHNAITQKAEVSSLYSADIVEELAE
ncbi:MAG: ABC transporter substrate-binding protein [Spirochaetales bacterium]|nr:ABC transporter substrate-binding protein [Spirochaetales bacterium]